jgi:hypothetical protein
VLASRVVLGSLVLVAAPAAGPGPARAADAEPAIVDAHIHYSQDAWAAYPADRALRILTDAGISRAFVSSTPDEGTLRLYRLAPGRIIPVLRPYRDRGDMGGWHRDPSVVAYLEERLAAGTPYRGIGEFHLAAADARRPVVQQVAELAARRGLFLHCHCDAEAVATLHGLRPDVRVLWAHAGMASGPAEVGALLDRSPRLWVELALRGDVAPGGVLDPAWLAVFTRHPDRFLVGTDTWVPSRWDAIPAVQAGIRAWLRQLPPDLARRLASENAERLAGPSP